MSNKGFTLTELLVVIGIMVVILGMLMPALISARNGALRMECAKRLKDLAFIVNAYSVDYRGYYPYLDNNDPEDDTNGFEAKLKNYMGTKTKDVFKCTRPASDAKTDSYFFYYNLFNSEYPTSPAILHQNAPSAPPTPRGDTGTGAVPVFMCRSSESYYPHSHGVNVVYADGHAAWEKK